MNKPARKPAATRRHRRACRVLLPVEQVDEAVVVIPEVYLHCGKPLRENERRGQSRVWRHQVVELLPSL